MNRYWSNTDIYDLVKMVNNRTLTSQLRFALGGTSLPPVLVDTVGTGEKYQKPKKHKIYKKGNTKKISRRKKDRNSGHHDTMHLPGQGVCLAEN